MSFDPFDPIAAAKLRMGETLTAIKATGRDEKFEAPAGNDMDFRALTLQAALRVLVPATQRDGIYPPSNARNPLEPGYLHDAQALWYTVFKGGKDANDAQNIAALTLIRDEAIPFYQRHGYLKLAGTLENFLKDKGFAPAKSTAATVRALPSATPSGPAPGKSS